LFGQAGEVRQYDWSGQQGQQDDGPMWVGSPTKNTLIAGFTQPKIFGQGGQPPTPRWWPQNSLDDPPSWPGATVGSFMPKALIAQSMFGAPGQPLQRNWDALVGLQDDAAPWVGMPRASVTLPKLAVQKFFGALGQVPAKSWSVQYLNDDASSWNGA